ncbi:MAG: hypothetical protein JOZ69_05465 [Myxococcales bacterium]|nr:hypothetical protein [Myxococcales bacterium]
MNLGLVMRKALGYGTPREAAAALGLLFLACWAALTRIGELGASFFGTHFRSLPGHSRRAAFAA